MGAPGRRGRLRRQGLVPWEGAGEANPVPGRRLPPPPTGFCSPSEKNPQLEAGWLRDLTPFARPARRIRTWRPAGCATGHLLLAQREESATGRRLAARPGTFCSPSEKDSHLEAGWLRDRAPFARLARRIRTWRPAGCATGHLLLAQRGRPNDPQDPQRRRDRAWRWGVTSRKGGSRRGDPVQRHPPRFEVVAGGNGAVNGP
jgi:hypothetical protein